MAIENEWKYLLAPDFAKYYYATKFKNGNTIPAYDQIDPNPLWRFSSERIEQGYLGLGKSSGPPSMTTRIRKLFHLDKSSVWVVTHKIYVNNRNIELEEHVNEADGQQLWSWATNHVRKERFNFTSPNAKWMLDFFFSKSDFLYLILLEAEVADGESRPEVPAWIKPYVCHEVFKSDSNFSNSRLGDTEHATYLYRSYNGVGPPPVVPDNDMMRELEKF